jgi:hypothetical protein
MIILAVTQKNEESHENLKDKSQSCSSHKKTDRRLLPFKTGIHTHLPIFLALHRFKSFQHNGTEAI